MSFSCSGAHLNPAVSLSFCVLGDLQWFKLLPYSLAQVLGAYLASGLVYLIYYGKKIENTFKIISNMYLKPSSVLLQMQLWSSVVEFWLYSALMKLQAYLPPTQLTWCQYRPTFWIRSDKRPLKIGQGLGIFCKHRTNVMP